MRMQSLKILLFTALATISSIAACQEKSITEIKWRTDTVKTELTESIGTVEFLATDYGVIYTVKIKDNSPYGILSSHDSYRVYDGDYVKISLTAKNDDKRIFVFIVNRSGTTSDYLNDAAGRYDDAWTSKWDAESVSDENGYTVTVKIPWAALQTNFKDFNGKTLISVLDNNQKLLDKDRNKLVANLNYDKNNACFECQMLTVPKDTSVTVTDGEVANDKSIAVEYEPYIIALKGEQTNFDAGLDVKISKESNSALITINPDYSSVETDGFYNTENSLYAVERSENRLFFQKIGSALSSKLNLLYTRSIINPTIGGQYHYAKGDYEYDGFVSNDSTTSFTVFNDNSSYIETINQDSLNFGAKVFFNKNDKSYYGGMLLQRNASGYRNSVLSIDGSNKINSSTFSWQVAGSNTAASDEYNTKNGTGYAMAADWDFSKSGYSSSTSFNYIDSNFQSSMGSVGSPGGSFYHYSSYSKDDLKFIDKINFYINYNMSYDEKLEIETSYTKIGANFNKDKYSSAISASIGRDYDNVIGVGKTYRVNASLKRQFQKCSASASYTSGNGVDYINSTTGTIKVKSFTQSCKNNSLNYGLTIMNSLFSSNHPGAEYGSDSVYLSAGWLINKTNEISVSADFFELNSTMNSLRPLDYQGVNLSLIYNLSLGRRANIVAGINYYSEKVNGFDYKDDTFYIKWLGSF